MNAQSWPQFQREYRVQIAGMARKIHRRWQMPEAVELEDIVQELTLAAWLAWNRWEPGRGRMSRAAFAICSGRLAAQRWVHQQRDALRRSGKNPSRFPVASLVLSSPSGFEEQPSQERARMLGDYSFGFGFSGGLDMDPRPNAEETAVYLEELGELLRVCSDVERRMLEDLLLQTNDVGTMVAKIHREMV